MILLFIFDLDRKISIIKPSFEYLHPIINKKSRRTETRTVLTVHNYYEKII